MADDEILLKIRGEVEDAQAKVDKLNGSLSKTGSVAKSTQANVSDLNKNFQALTGISLGTAGAIGAIGMALDKSIDFLKESINETVAYSKTVRELSINLGTSAEETSKLIQVADDYMVSTKELETAMNMALKNGFVPTIENLSILADQYNAMSDPAAKAAMLSDIFGRQWAAITPILAAGSKGIQEAAAAAEDLGLVLSGEAVQAARDYEIALDGIQDAALGLKITLGTGLLPVLTDIANNINFILSTGFMTGMPSQLPESVIGNLPGGFKMSEEQMAYWRGLNEESMGVAGGFQSQAGAIQEAEQAIAGYNSAIDAMPSMDALMDITALSGGTQELEISFDDLGAAAEGAINAVMDAIEKLTTEGSDALKAAYVQWKNRFIDPSVAGFNEINNSLRNIMLSIVALNNMTIEIGYSGWRPGINPVTAPTGHYAGGFSGDIRGAGGLGFSVPSMFPADQFRMSVNAGERVQVTPAGQANSDMRELIDEVRGLPMQISRAVRDAVVMVSG